MRSDANCNYIPITSVPITGKLRMLMAKEQLTVKDVRHKIK